MIIGIIYHLYTTKNNNTNGDVKKLVILFRGTIVRKKVIKLYIFSQFNDGKSNE